ncbi:membrane protein [Streptomyces ruber]|uniref:Membrane protein n=2 Tax=Streptomyces TaxID=1883 RepID=A0A918BGA1_9ACTN|nr:hypothetical protein [Streptomyces ruber]GGQ66608.1 membrane protein [Streptomyces ruber]
MNTERPEPEDYDATSDAAGGTRGAEGAGGSERPARGEAGFPAGSGPGTGSRTPAGSGTGPDPGSSPAAGASAVPAAGGKRPRRRPSTVVGAVAAAVLLAGGGGAYLAATADGHTDGGLRAERDPGAGGAPPPLALGGHGRDTGGGVAPGEPHPGGAAYRADGDLPGGPDSAPVYRPAGEVTSADVTRLARALGVEGTPRAEGRTWRVGTVKDGSGPVLRVNRQAPGTWSFSRYTPGTDNCGKPDVCARGSASGGAPVSEAAAKEAAAPVLEAVGQGAAELDAGQVTGAVRVVNADPEVGGLPTYGWATGIQVGADGRVVGGSGNLKAPEKDDTYPVIDSRKALDLMNEPGPVDGGGRQGIGGCAGPVPLRERDGSPCPAPTVGPEPEPLTVAGAVFGLAAHHVDGEQALVPSWLFEVRPNGTGRNFTVTHPAVDPAYLAAAEPAEPSPRVPAEPGGDATAAPPAARDVKIEGWTADGSDLTVSFWGGVCSQYSASADEETGRVTVTATEKPAPPGKVCITIARATERTVRLDAPLGDREVVGSDGRRIPEGDLVPPTPPDGE